MCVHARVYVFLLTAVTFSVEPNSPQEEGWEIPISWFSPVTMKCTVPGEQVPMAVGSAVTNRLK